MSIDALYDKVNQVIHFVLFTLGDTKISLGSLVKFLVILLVFIFLARRMSRLLAEKILSRLPLQEGTRYVFKRIIEYVILVVGIIIAFNSINIDLRGLAVIFGLLSVGIGFGLQNITSNFISGLILLFEQPIKVGDRVTVGDTEGDVTEINIRSTTIRTLNNISYIVPNSDFISSKVINWTYDDTRIRIDIKVGVSYNSDLNLVIRSLQQAARENSEVLKEPEPEVLFMEFGDSAWNMILRVWINNPKRYYYIRSDINCAIVHLFRKNNIEIPFPQTDVHLYTTRPVQAALQTTT